MLEYQTVHRSEALDKLIMMTYYYTILQKKIRKISVEIKANVFKTLYSFKKEIVAEESSQEDIPS